MPAIPPRGFRPLRRSRSRPCHPPRRSPVRARHGPPRLASASRADDSSAVSRPRAPWEPIAPSVAPGGGRDRIPVEVFSALGVVLGRGGVPGPAVKGVPGVCLGGGAGRVALGAERSRVGGWSRLWWGRRARPRGDAAARRRAPAGVRVESEREQGEAPVASGVGKGVRAPPSPSAGRSRGLLPPPPSPGGARSGAGPRDAAVSVRRREFPPGCREVVAGPPARVPVPAGGALAPLLVLSSFSRAAARPLL